MKNLLSGVQCRQNEWPQKQSFLNMFVVLINSTVRCNQMGTVFADMSSLDNFNMTSCDLESSLYI